MFLGRSPDLGGGGMAVGFELRLRAYMKSVSAVKAVVIGDKRLRGAQPSRAVPI